MTQPINPSTIAARVRPLVVEARSAPRRAAHSAALGLVRIDGASQVMICYYGQDPEYLDLNWVPESDNTSGGRWRLQILQAALEHLRHSHDLIQVAIIDYQVIPDLQAYTVQHAPNVDVLDEPTSYLTPYFNALLSARTNIQEEMRFALAAEAEERRQAEALKRRIAEKQHWKVATDASMQTGRAGAGIACIREDGRHRYEYLPQVNSVFAAEVLAIELAIRKFSGRLTIYSDSQDAVNLVRAVLAGEISYHRSKRIHSAITSIIDRSADRKISINWVRGHNGSALNETADRLARFARRAHHSHVKHLPKLIAQVVPDQVATEIVDNIISDYRAVN